MSLVNNTREDNNVNDHHRSPQPNFASSSASDTSMPKDIIDDALIMLNSLISFFHTCECEEGKMFEDDVNGQAYQFDECHISNGGKSCEEDVIELSPSNVELTDSIP